MKLRYVGPARPGVDVVIDGASVHVPHSGTVEVTGDAAKSLLATGEWSRADAPRKAPKKKAAAKSRPAKPATAAAAATEPPAPADTADTTTQEG